MDSYPYHMIKWDPQPTVGGSWARVHAEGDMVPSRHFPFFFLFLFDFDRLTLVSDIDGYSFSLSLLRNLVALECTVPLNLTEFSKRVVVSLFCLFVTAVRFSRVESPPTRTRRQWTQRFNNSEARRPTVVVLTSPE